MIKIDNFAQVTAQIETERGVSKQALKEAIEQALISACRRQYTEEAVLNAVIDPETGEARIMQTKTVVKKITNDLLEISVKEAKKIKKTAKIDEEITFEVIPSDFGRIAAQTAKQVIIQRIREAEKTAILDDFKSKIGSLVTGTIQRIEPYGYLVNLGRTEALLHHKEQIPGETYNIKDKIRLYVSDVVQSPKGPKIIISRTHSGFLKCLFNLEIPEIDDGIIEIKSISREPGKRSKVAVKTNNPSIGAVGTCVGHLGSRIQSIIKELGDEKIDILEWDEDIEVFIGNSLKPAQITKVKITNEEQRQATAVVPNDQLSLAIGKNGINVRLAVKLTGWKLDISNEDDFQKKERDSGLSLAEKMQLEKEKNKEESDSDPDENKKPDIMDSEETGSEETVPEDTQPIKVSIVAKELKMKTADLIEKAQTFGVSIKSNRVTLSPDQVKTIRENFSI
ncbi:MAG: transcription termination/antitermination protein NusA [Candidatus Margulisbacteria bacterium]|nr:transcription termination/antitermination protein NusA [Candidatus Margulisiibacteriota bacterium]